MIVSMTLAGNAQDTIGEALASVVDWVDLCLVVDTGITDDTIRRAAEAAGAKLRVRHFTWTGDFSAARNFSLRVAAELDADWAMTLDTDERMVFEGGFNLKSRLLSAPAEILLVQQQDRSYWKERLFKLPSTVTWRGPAHETLDNAKVGAKLPGVRFWELEKTPEQLAVKHRRDIEALGPYANQHADESRWWYFLGASHHGAQEYRAAIECYARCALVSKWNEEAAWARYAQAMCLWRLGENREAVEVAAAGLAARPATAELAWLAAIACYEDKKYQDAIAWAQMSAVNGGDQFPRTNFCDRVGLYEGPWQILYMAHSALGNDEQAGLAESKWHEMKGAR